MRGFTLLEVLAALAVLGLLLAGLAQGVQFGLRAWDMQARDVAWRNDIEAVDRAIRLLIRRVRSGAEVRDRASVLGGPQSCELMTVLPPPPAGLAGPVVARLEVDAAHRLVLRWLPAPHVTWAGPPPRPQQAVLLERIERLEFAYWKDQPGGGGGWQRAWDEPEPPSLVRLRIVFPPGDGRRWPDIVAAPRLDRTSSRFLLFPARDNVNIASRATRLVDAAHAG
jgi:general secretion pathway protein J